MLKILSELNGVSGNEKIVADFILSQVSDLADETICDSMGNLIFLKKGKKPNSKKVALFAHMDEVGFIVTDITDDGYIKFAQVGGLDDRILLTQKVKIGKNAIDGVIGIKAVHLQTKDERGKVIKTDEMYIDIGATSAEDAKKYVSKGDYISFQSEFVWLHNMRFKGKAIDDRAGCAIMMELMKEKYDSDVYFCFTVQEETGLRGASVLSRRINPDVALVFEATTASDTAFIPKHLHATTLGKGPAITMMDKGSYSNIALKEFVVSVANDRGIDFQYKLTANGGNDARAVQTGASGAKVCSVSLPCRYIHSPSCVADLRDYENMKKLARAVLNEIHNFEPEPEE
ncbi:MAG: M42 family metallopeptidase [Ruminococcaceae bacterium]|nr:M42 family metallopeptidase [Oscillospiraceae bacterium]